MPPKCHKQIFWSGGIGDIIALEASMTDEYRESITRMYWATRAQSQLAPLFSKLPSFPNLKDHVSLWDDFSIPGTSFRDFEQACALTPCQINEEVEDWSIIKKFPNMQPFTYSSFVKYKLADKRKLPDKYIVLCPYSTAAPLNTQQWRRFSEKDWEWLLNHLDETKTYGVILNMGDDPIPINKWIINLSNKTSLAEAFEILKTSQGYIGIGSSFAVLATKIFSNDRITVCKPDDGLYICKSVYYAPKREFDFIVLCLGSTKEEAREWREKTDRNILEWAYSDPVISPPLSASGGTTSSLSSE